METLCGANARIFDDSTKGRSKAVDVASVFQEIDEALDLCTLVYTVTMLRRLVREQKVDQHADAIMKLPLSMAEADDLVLAERHHLTLSKHAENKRIFTNIVKTLNDRRCHSRDDKSPRKPPRSPKSAAEGITDTSPSFITAFGGETANNALVYGVSVSHERKVVTLCFRGAETDIDWAPLNTEVYMKEISNPMKRHPSQAPTVKIHNQLHDFLLSPSLRDTNNTSWTDISEYQEILEEQVIPILMEHRGYKLYVTGHSLGGALATLFAFLAAAEPDTMIPKPVTCISIGSSYVGDKTFRAAHQLLEGLQKLRHLRISNHKDSVTLSPKVSFRWEFSNKKGYGGTAFKHVGLNLRLYPGKTPFEVSYPSVRRNFVATGFDEITRAWDNSIMTNMTCNPTDYITWPFHQIREYNVRVLRSKELLEATTLNTLYTDPIIVGDLFSHHYK